MNAPRWKELFELLTAGAEMIPLADNDAAYRRLEERLEALHSERHAEQHADEERAKAA